MPAGAEGGLRDRGEVALGPGGAFRAFEDDGVAGEEGGDYGAQEVMELLEVSICLVWEGVMG